MSVTIVGENELRRRRDARALVLIALNEYFRLEQELLTVDELGAIEVRDLMERLARRLRKPEIAKYLSGAFPCSVESSKGGLMIVRLQETPKGAIYAWVENKRGWTLDTSDYAPAWREFDSTAEVAGIGGQVLCDSERKALVLMFGRPEGE